jgi:hypothetical protein
MNPRFKTPFLRAGAFAIAVGALRVWVTHSVFGIGGLGILIGAILIVQALVLGRATDA